MEALLRDLRLAVRSLGTESGFTVVGVLTLALGIGATTAVFSVVYGVLLRPLPFPGADRLVKIVQAMRPRAVRTTGYRAGLSSRSVSEPPGTRDDARRRSASSTHALRTLTGIPIPARLNGAAVLPGLFDGVGARALRGRTLRARRRRCRARSRSWCSATGRGVPALRRARGRHRHARHRWTTSPIARGRRHARDVHVPVDGNGLVDDAATRRARSKTRQSSGSPADASDAPVNEHIVQHHTGLRRRETGRSLRARARGNPLADRAAAERQGRRRSSSSTHA